MLFVRSVSGQVVDKTSFAKRLEAEITRRGWTNDEAARALGVPERQVRRWRKGSNQPSRNSLRALTKFFGWEESP